MYWSWATVPYWTSSWTPHPPWSSKPTEKNTLEMPPLFEKYWKWCQNSATLELCSHAKSQGFENAAGVSDPKHPLFPTVHTVLPNNALLRLATIDDDYSSMLNATDRDVFQLGFDTSILKKRLYLEMETTVWQKDYVKFLKETDSSLTSESGNTTDFT